MAEDPKRIGRHRALVPFSSRVEHQTLGESFGNMLSAFQDMLSARRFSVVQRHIKRMSKMS